MRAALADWHVLPLWLGLAGMLLASAAPAAADTRFIELRPSLCHAVSARELAPALLEQLRLTCSAAPQGYSDRWLWLHTPAPAALRRIAGDWVLLIDQPRWRTISVAVRYDDGGIWSDRISAGAVGEHWAAGGYLKFVVPRRAARPAAVTIGFERLASWQLVRKVRAAPIEQHLRIEQRWTLLIGIVGGAISAALGYNLFLFAGLRDRYLTRYVLWSLFTLAHALCWSNVIFLVAPWLAGPWGVRLNLWTAAGALFFSLSFFVSFIEPGKLPGWLRRAVLPLGGALVAVAAIGAFEELAPTAVMAQLFDALILVGVVAVLAGTVTAIRRGSRSARYYLVAWVPAIVALVMRIARNIGLIPHSDFADQGVFLGAALQTVLLSMAMSDRFVRWRRERDIAAAEREELRLLSETDPLTGLLNRRGFIWRVQAMLGAAPSRVGLLLLDVDHFKSINDRLGHDVGDAVLARLSQAIAGVLRDGDVAGRLGGEEFGIAVPVIDPSALQALAERVRAAAALTDLTDVLGHGWRVTVSIGVVSASFEPGAGFERLYRMADQALYEAKLGGRNRVATARQASATRPTIGFAPAV